MNILVIAAHPDDEVLGCGGTMARMSQEGHSVYSMILGEGITSRDVSRDVEKSKNDIAELQTQVREANRLLGVKDVLLFEFPDNRFDTVPLLDIVKVIERVKNEIKPDVVFTHYEHDLNIDHQVTYKAVITASRPMVGETIKEIYSFEIPSSTEWSYSATFSPNVFYDVSDSMGRKIGALEKYTGEMKDFPHPRSIKGVEHIARNWGIKVGRDYAEAFQLVRVTK